MLSARAGDRTVYQEPSVRQFVFWTPELICSARIAAEGGWLDRAALLCEDILGDDRAMAVLNTRANALLGCDLNFEVGTGSRKRAALKALEDEDDFGSAFAEEELRRLLVWGVLLGIGVAQIIWVHKDPEDATSRLIPQIKVWHPRFLRWDWQKNQWFIKVDEFGKEIPIAAGDGKWILFTPYGSSRPWAYGLWRGMSLLWLFKRYAMQDWGKHSEVHGMPIRVGYLPPKSGELTPNVIATLRADLANDIANFGNETTFVPPPGFDLKLVEATARTWEMFQAQINMANSSMAIMAIGGDLATESKAGATTAATAQTLVRDDYRADDGKTLSTCLRMQALLLWAEFNFGRKAYCPWTRWRTEPEDDLAGKATQFAEVCAALADLAKAGGRISDDNWLEDTFEFPITMVLAAAPLAAPVLALPPGPVKPALLGPAPAKPAKAPTDDVGRAGQMHLLSGGALPVLAYRGIYVTIDRPQGFIQSGEASDGTTWTRTYQVPYGFIRGTAGGDATDLDVFCGPDAGAVESFWIVQLKPDGTFDEYKVVFGCASHEEAMALWAAHVPARLYGGCFAVPMEALRALLGLHPSQRALLLTSIQTHALSMTS